MRNLMSERTEGVVSGTDQYSQIAKFLIMNVLGSPEMSLRRAAHYIKRLNIILTSISNDPDVVFVAVVALIARAYDSENYFKFNNGEITDDEFANSLFKKIDLRRINRDFEGAYIAVVLISAQFVMNGGNFADKNGPKKSTLLSNYGHLSVNNDSPKQDARDYAINVMKIYNLFQGQRWELDHFGRSYLDVMKHIALLLPKGDDNENKI